MFIDIAKIKVKAGKGGDGKVSFLSAIYIKNGGPDGGDGGFGGNVIFQTDSNLSTLMDFRYKKVYSAKPGENGGSRNCTGKSGASITIRVPYGTIIRDTNSNAIIKDLSDNEPYIVAKGGRGGWGNSHFATPTRQAPRFAKAGIEGEELDITLELKLLADVGLIGYPNVGKSTILSIISAARPKIANYHFTTIIPNLGVVYIEDGASFVAADIPGLIEGASEGAGLGHYFLRHVDRCRLLIHVVDISGTEGRDPIEDFKTINTELKRFNEELSERPQIVVANKTDLLTDRAAIDNFKSYIEGLGYTFLEMCAATSSGINELKFKCWEMLKHLPPITIYEPEYKKPDISYSPDNINIRVENNIYHVEGPYTDRLMSNINIDEVESRMHLELKLRKANIFKRLEDMGIVDGDTVCINGFEFEYLK